MLPRLPPVIVTVLIIALAVTAVMAKRGATHQTPFFRIDGNGYRMTFFAVKPLDTYVNGVSVPCLSPSHFIQMNRLDNAGRESIECRA